MEEEKVVLVDLKDQQLGTMGKMEAHEKTVLHRAFSIFILNSNQELLLQQRAFGKYHSPGLWTNTCCSHQREGESNLEAGNRRMMEEMGMTVPLQELFTFIYKASFDNGLTEHERVSVFSIHVETPPPMDLNPDEVMEVRWINYHALKAEVQTDPDKFTPWLKIYLNEHSDRIFDAKLLKSETH